MPDENPSELPPQPTPPAAKTSPAIVERLAHFRTQFSDLPRWARRGGFALASVTVVLLVSNVVGFSISAFNLNMADKHLASLELLEEENSELGENVEATESRLDRAEWDVASLRKKAAEKARAETALLERETAVAAAESALVEREVAVGAAEAQKTRQEVRNGVHVIGTTVEPGIYQTTGPTSSSCYYAWKSGTGSDADIVDNNITQGAATVTLVAGEVFESSRCAVWTKVG